MSTPDSSRADLLPWRSLLFWGEITAALIVPTSALGRALAGLVPAAFRSVVPRWSEGAPERQWLVVEALGTLLAIVLLGAVIAVFYRGLGYLIEVLKIPEDSRRPPPEPDA